MALLRLPSSPSTPYSPTDHHPKLHKTPLLLSTLSSSSPHNKPDSHLSLLCSISFHSRKIIKTNPFFSRFLPLTQSPLAISTSLVLNVASKAQPEVEPKADEDAKDQYSKNRLLASNVPWTCAPEDIRALFEKFGTVVDVELSMHNKIRNRGLAFVTMGSPEEALAALKGLELYEFEGRTLKMNYAKPKQKKASPPTPPKTGITFNLFVANLSFEARAKDLKEFFVSDGANCVSAEIIFHDNPRKSSGYGFVSFKTKKEADEALAAFQGKMFMGRPLRVARSRQFARQPKEEEEKGPQPVDTTTELDLDTEQADTADGN